MPFAACAFAPDTKAAAFIQASCKSGDGRKAGGLEIGGVIAKRGTPTPGKPPDAWDPFFGNACGASPGLLCPNCITFEDVASKSGTNDNDKL